MNIIKETQVGLIMNEAIKTSQENGESLSVKQLRALLDNLLINDILGKPIFAGIPLTRLQSVDYLNTHNTNIKGLNLDYRTLTASTAWIYDEVNKLNEYTDNMTSFFSVMEARIRNTILNIRKRQELGRKSVIIDFKDATKISQSSTCAIDYVNGKATLRKLSEGDRIFKFKDPALTTIKSDFNGASVLNIEKMTTALDPAYYGEVFFNVLTTDPTHAVGQISFRLDEQDVAPVLNAITIQSRNKSPTKTEVIIVSDGLEIPVGTETLLNQNETFSFESTTVEAVIIKLEQSIYNQILGNQFEFVFRYGALLLENTITTNTDTVQSEAIQDTEELTSVSIRTIEKTPSDTSITYYVSPTGSSWSKITPINYGANSFNSVDIGIREDRVLEDIGTTDGTDPWEDLSPLATYGNSVLYNILEKSSSSAYVSANALYMSGDAHIDKDNIQLLRGKDNYAIETKTIETDVFNENSLYIFTTRNGRLNAPSIYVNVLDEANIVNANLKVTLAYTPTHSLYIRVFDSDGDEVEIRQQVGKILTLRGVTRGSTVYVNYTAALSTIESTDNVTITVDEDSFEVRNVPDGDDLGGRGVIYDRANKIITLSPNNPYNVDFANNNTYQLYISFKYKIETENEIKVYTTNVQYETQTDIKIYPFTQEEIKAGNIHMIDNQIVSSLSEYTMEKGWHTITTTQPYKSDTDNIYDVNSLTSKPSAAGIKLTDVNENITYAKMWAFSDSMKLVSTKNLANRVRKGDHRSFALSTDNKILINFVPEELPVDFESNASHLQGTELLGKKVIYSSDEFSYYERVDDSFELYYTIIDESKSGTDVYVKAVLAKEPTAVSSPEVHRIELILS